MTENKKIFPSDYAHLRGKSNLYQFQVDISKYKQFEDARYFQFENGEAYELNAQT